MKTANLEYGLKRKHIQDQLVKINRLQLDHAKKQLNDDQNWGLVGDLKRVLELLEQAANILEE